MKAWNRNVVPVVLAIGGLMWLLPTVKQLIKGEEIRGVFIVFAILCFTLAVGSHRRAAAAAAARKAESDSGPPSA